ncbi:hypothetical protein [Dactylosporangium salmoneum]|uniref:DUF2567 domain-containing protein n=1 Tax=Dactylosporangium salmoneum TaxID=53361 RepID=A0ABN3GKC8_9ACTN
MKLWRTLAQAPLLWSLRAASASLPVFVVGLALFVVLGIYDLQHWDAVTAQSYATYTIDDHGAGFAIAWLMEAAAVLLAGITIAVLVYLTAGMLRRNHSAWRASCVLMSIYLLGCALLLPDWIRGSDGPDTTGTAITVTHDRTTPVWVRAVDGWSHYLILGGAAVTLILLLLPATRRAFKQGSEQRLAEPSAA